MKRKFLSVMLFAAITFGAAGTFTSCKDYDDDIEGLQEQLDKKASIEDLTKKVTALESAIDAAKKEAVDAADKAMAKAGEALDAATKNGQVADEALDKAKQALTSASSALEEIKNVNASITDINKAIEEANAKIDDVVKANSDLSSQFEGLKKSLENYATKTYVDDQIKAVKDMIAEAGKGGLKIEDVKAEVAKVSKAVDELLGKRLTSIVLAPDSYINGVEAMVFNSYNYLAWEKVEADYAGTDKVMRLADGTTTARYYVSPSSVTKDDIKNLRVIWNNKVSNPEVFTKALEQKDVPVSIESYDVKDGVLLVNFRKESSKAFENGNENFSIIAIQAEVSLTDEEVANGVSPVVTSDWVRLNEKAVHPYIHFAEAGVPHEDVDLPGEGIETLEAAKHPHFFKYTQIFNANNKKDEGKFIVKDVPYTDTLDLMKMVNVCLDGQKILEDYEADSMKFVFGLPKSYELQKEGEEATDQQFFAAFLDDECTKVVSRAHDNTAANNRDAIGRQPVIRVELHDVKNNEIMDVRYFKIRWYDPALYIPEIWDADTLANETKDFACNQDYEIMVGTKVMNELIYQVIRQNGMSKEEFHAKYDYLNPNAFASKEDAIAGNNANSLGSMELIKGGKGEAITYNIKWTYNSGMEMTNEEYEAGFKTITVWGRFVNALETKKNLVVFPLTLTLKIEKMQLTAGYLGSYWNKGQELDSTNKMKSFQVNPSMMKDEFLGTAKFKDAQLIANILDAYLNVEATNEKFADETELTNAEKAEFIFDASRLEECGLKLFSVSVDGKQLMLGNTVAAEIVVDEDKEYSDMNRAGWIRLYENPRVTAAEHGDPSDAAISLLGKNLPITLATENCAGVKAELDHFLVNIIRPLKLEAKAMENKLTDLLHDGSFVRVDSVLRISENFSGQFSDANIVWENGKEVTPGLVEWYNVQIAEWDLKNAITNLIKEGNNLIPSDDQWGFKLSDVNKKYVFTACNDWKNDVTKPETTVKEVVYIKFENKSGTHLQRDLRLLVPVKVATKWGMLEAKVELTVKPGIAVVDPVK